MENTITDRRPMWAVCTRLHVSHESLLKAQCRYDRQHDNWSALERARAEYMRANRAYLRELRRLA